MKEMKIKKNKKTKRVSIFERKKILFSELSDKELGLLMKKMKKKINLIGINTYGKDLLMTLIECLKRTNTTDVNLKEVQDLIKKLFFRKYIFDKKRV
jgi:hypothetical protein